MKSTIRFRPSFNNCVLRRDALAAVAVGIFASAVGAVLNGYSDGYKIAPFRLIESQIDAQRIGSRQNWVA